MKILLISTRIPQLDGKGDELVAYWRIKALRESGHSVHLVCCMLSSLSSLDTSALKALRLIGVSFDIVQVPLLRQLINFFFLSVLGRWPAQVSLYKSPYCRRLLKGLCDSYSPDLVHLFLIRSYPNIPLTGFSIVIDFVDSISLNYSREASSSSLPLRLLYSIESKRCHRLEMAIAESAVCSFAVAMTDVNHISPDRVCFLPNGVDSLRFAPTPHASSQPFRLIFTGNMSYAPNVKAITWFCEHCWPAILASIPDATLYICGSSPSPLVLGIPSRFPSVYVTGRVQSICSEICLSSIAIAPMQSGAGMQNKILEAMSCGVPVVTTSLGLGSIGVFGAPCVLVADTALEFVDSVLQLLSNRSMRARLGSLSRDYILQNHDWSSIGQRFVSALESQLS